MITNFPQVLKYISGTLPAVRNEGTGDFPCPELGTLSSFLFNLQQACDGMSSMCSGLPVKPGILKKLKFFKRHIHVSWETLVDQRVNILRFKLLVMPVKTIMK